MVYDTMDDLEDNIKPCSRCGKPTSFERKSDADPHEGSVCDRCDRCVDCIDWSATEKLLVEDQICIDCAKETRVFYHGTFISNIQSILENGLIPSSDASTAIWPELKEFGYVYLSHSIREARAWPTYAVKCGLESVEYITDPKPAVIRVDASALNASNISEDPITKKDVRYRGVIPACALSLVQLDE